MPQWIVTFDKFEKMNGGRWDYRRRTKREFRLQGFISIAFLLSPTERASIPHWFFFDGFWRGGVGSESLEGRGIVGRGSLL